VARKKKQKKGAPKFTSENQRTVANKHVAQKVKAAFKNLRRQPPTVVSGTKAPFRRLGQLQPNIKFDKGKAHARKKGQKRVIGHKGGR